MAQWLESWENSKLQIPTLETFSASQRTLLCQASLTENLLDSAFNTTRFQSDPIGVNEERFLV